MFGGELGRNSLGERAMEVWLRTNRRVLLMGMILPAVLVAVGLLPVLALGPEKDGWVRILGTLGVFVGVFLFAVIAIQMRSPRLAYADGQVLVYLRSGAPIGVPVETVECFFMGSGIGQVPGREGKGLPMRNLMMRVAEKATDFQQRDVKQSLGTWDEGYVTFHGAWCEPLTLEVVQRLNARLAEVQRSRREFSAR